MLDPMKITPEEVIELRKKQLVDQLAEAITHSSALRTAVYQYVQQAMGKSNAEAARIAARMLLDYAEALENEKRIEALVLRHVPTHKPRRREAIAEEEP